MSNQSSGQYVNARTGGNYTDQQLYDMGVKWDGMDPSQFSGGGSSGGGSGGGSGGSGGNTPTNTAPSTSNPKVDAVPNQAPISTPTAPANPFDQQGSVISGNQGQTTSGSYTPQDQTVESRIPGLLSTDNPIVQTAVGQTTQAANARGLVNSTMAVQAGQQAAEASVLPIAQADAAAAAAQNLSKQGAYQTGALQGQSIQGTLANTGLSIQGQQEQLSQQIQAQNAQLSASLGSQERLQAAQLAMNKAIAGQQLDANETMLVQQLNEAMEQTKITTGSQQQISQNTLTQQQQAQVKDASGQYAAIYQDAVNQINNNKDMSADARTAGLKMVQAQYNSNMNLLSHLYGVSLTWTITGPDSSVTDYAGNVTGGAPTATVVQKATPVTPVITGPFG